MSPRASRWRGLSAFVLLAALASISVPSIARAADPTAEKKAAREFGEAQRAYDAGDFRRAAQGFEAAYALKPHHNVLWNAARSWQRAGEDLRAANLLERYLREAPANAPDRAEATAALAKVDKEVGRLQLQLVGDVKNVRLDGEPVTGTARYLAPGDHVATADVDDKPFRKVFSVGRGEVVSVTLAPPPPPPAPLPPAPVETPPPPVHSGISPWFVATGVAVVGLGAAASIFSGLDTLHKKDTFLASQTQDNLDSGNASQTRTNVLVATTAGLAVITAVVAVFFVDWSGSSSSRTQAAQASRIHLDLAPFQASIAGPLP